MPGKCLVTGLLAAMFVSLTGCCAWCQRHCQPVCCPSYAPPPAVCCPAPAPACCPPTTQFAPAPAQYGPPPQQWQRTFSSPQNCSCQ